MQLLPTSAHSSLACGGPGLCRFVHWGPRTPGGTCQWEPSGRGASWASSETPVQTHTRVPRAAACVSDSSPGCNTREMRACARTCTGACSSAARGCRRPAAGEAPVRADGQSCVHRGAAGPAGRAVTMGTRSAHSAPQHEVGCLRGGLTAPAARPLGLLYTKSDFLFWKYFLLRNCS